MSEPEVRAEAACYLHPDRPALTRCSRCEQPICGDDLIEAPVGYQCPKCAEGGQPVKRLADLQAAPVTRALVYAIGGVYLLSMVVGFGALYEVGALVPTRVGVGEVWRIVTSGFLHAQTPLHVLFNGYLLWILGHQLEPRMRPARFVTLFAGGLVGGGLGVVLLSYLTVLTPLVTVPVLGDILATNPFGRTVGASGAVFGLFGAALVAYRRQGVNPWRTDIGSLVLLNLVITVVFSGSISVGGHVGGLAAGALVGAILLRDRGPTSLRIAIGAVVGLTVVTIALARVLVASFL